VSQVPAGAHGVVYLPYLSTAGIVSPFAEPNARGMFFGISADTTRADLMRAVYDGTALAMRDCFEAIGQPVEEVVLVGGGARSAFWAQAFADATGRRIVLPSGTEFGARGAALLAGVGARRFGSIADAVAQTVSVARSYAPNPAAERAYDALYPLYRHLYTTSRDAWHLRAEVMQQLDI
jgi:sugar (pentulose or hexulose) kinase